MAMADGEAEKEPTLRDFYEHRDRIQTALADQDRRFYELRDQLRQRDEEQERRVCERLNDQDRRIATWWSRLGWGGPGVAVVALAGFAWLLLSVAATVQNKVEDEFSTPRIRRLMKEAADRAAVDELQPLLERAKINVAQVKRDTKRALRPLRAMSQVFELQAKAMGASRAAFDELRRLSDTSPDRMVRELAAGAYTTVYGIHGADVWYAENLEVADTDGVVKKNADISLETLLDVLSYDQDPAKRCGAAYNLKGKKDRRALPVLIGTIRKEPHLLALGCETYAVAQSLPPGTLSGPSGLFDWQPIVKWWDEHGRDFMAQGDVPPAPKP
jgi:hypothetical protein